VQADESIEALKEAVREYSGESGLGLLDEAYRFSREAHEGQFRASGEGFIAHPVAVAQVLASLRLDTVTIAAALLHDVVEDTGVGLDVIEQRFGTEITLLVDGVTKLTRLSSLSREEEQVENLRKMFLAMAQDIRVILIKLADRLHNLRTLGHLPAGRRREIARETLDVFAPLAHRLGIFRFKWEMEDLALRYLEPARYNRLVALVAKRRDEREAYINKVVGILEKKLDEAGIDAEIGGRPKHFYSIYRKMYVQGRDFSEIYDLMAVRVVVDTVKECYGVLGIVHSLWKPIPGRFKDFVAMPKPNMYQSLHTTVIGPEGEPFEIQIRTHDMHRTAEYGIAAHWRYKEAGRTDREFDEKLSWLRQILEWQNEMRDAREFMEQLKIDLFSDEVFVFTPKGEVIDLPAGAIPIDFAYRIHTDICHRCVGAKINGRIVPLDYNLKNGDIVEILTSKSSRGPSRDWIKMVKTSSARNRIRQWFRRERRDENLARGRELVNAELERQGLEHSDVWHSDWVREVAKKYNCRGEEELLIAIGYGGVSALQVVNRLRERLRVEQGRHGSVPARAEPGRPVDRAEKRAAAGERESVRVRGIDNALVRFSKCCNPIPGDPIIGYVTRGRGVSVHRVDCPNVRNLDGAERFIEVSWESDARPSLYPVEIAVSALDRPGLLSDVTRVIADTSTNILSASARSTGGARAAIDLVVEIEDLDQLSRLTRTIGEVRDVMSVDRVVKRKKRRRAT